jgi:predicted DNA-binding antitoxin AbrB/MazE fold protein
MDRGDKHMTFDAIYENGTLRPLEHIELSENQQVRVTVWPKVTDPGLRGLEDLIDWEYMEECRERAAEGPVPTLEEVREMLSKIPGSLADDIIAERQLR